MKFKLILAVAALTVTFQANAFNANKRVSNTVLNNNVPAKLQKVDICQDYPICNYFASRESSSVTNDLKRVNTLPTSKKVKLSPALQRKNFI